MAVAAVAAIVAMTGARLSRRARVRLVTAGIITGTGAVLAAPATWAASVLDTKYGGSSFNATAGPADDTAGGAGGGLTATAVLSSSQQRLYDYVSARRDGAGYLLAVPSWDDASTYILATGQEALNYGGGFSASVPSPTLTQMKNLVNTGQLRFIVVPEAGASTGMYGNRSATAAAIEAWAKKSCTEIPAKDYGGTTGTATSGAAAVSGTTPSQPSSAGTAPSGTGTPASSGFSGTGGTAGGGSNSETLYECSPA